MTEVRPGKCCPTCNHRIPYPRKATSPVTVTTSYRLPKVEKVVHEDTLKATAEHMGFFGRPHWKFNTINLAMVAALNDPDTKDFGKRFGNYE